MGDETSLTVVEQKTVHFYGDEIVAVQATDGTVYVPIRPICDVLGVQWAAQSKRIKRDDILSEVATSVSIMDTQHGQHRNMTCLPLEYLNGWIFGLKLSKTKPAVRESLKRYKRECYQVLADAFGRKQVAIVPDADIDVIIANDPDLSEAYNLAQVTIALIRSQARLRATVSDHEMRLQLIEADLGDNKRYVTNSQASKISQAVKAIALQLGKRSGRNEFGGVYGELYRRFKINSYEHLPAAQFAEGMDFLRQWYQSLVDNSDVPF